MPRNQGSQKPPDEVLIGGVKDYYWPPSTYTQNDHIFQVSTGIEVFDNSDYPALVSALRCSWRVPEWAEAEQRWYGLLPGERTTGSLSYPPDMKLVINQGGLHLQMEVRLQLGSLTALEPARFVHSKVQMRLLPYRLESTDREAQVGVKKKMDFLHPPGTLEVSWNFHDIMGDRLHYWIRSAWQRLMGHTLYQQGYSVAEIHSLCVKKIVSPWTEWPAAINVAPALRDRVAAKIHAQKKQWKERPTAFFAGKPQIKPRNKGLARVQQHAKAKSLSAKTAGWTKAHIEKLVRREFKDSSAPLDPPQTVDELRIRGGQKDVHGNPVSRPPSDPLTNEKYTFEDETPALPRLEETEALPAWWSWPMEQRHPDWVAPGVTKAAARLEGELARARQEKEARDQARELEVQERISQSLASPPSAAALEIVRHAVRAPVFLQPRETAPSHTGDSLAPPCGKAAATAVKETPVPTAVAVPDATPKESSALDAPKMPSPPSARPAISAPGPPTPRQALIPDPLSALGYITPKAPDRPPLPDRPMASPAATRPAPAFDLNELKPAKMAKTSRQGQLRSAAKQRDKDESRTRRHSELLYDGLRRMTYQLSDPMLADDLRARVLKSREATAQSLVKQHGQDLDLLVAYMEILQKDAEDARHLDRPMPDPHRVEEKWEVLMLQRAEKFGDADPWLDELEVMKDQW